LGLHVGDRVLMELSLKLEVVPEIISEFLDSLSYLWVV